MTPIERAARTLCKLNGHAEDAERDGTPLWRSYLPQVRSVLEALHEPSTRMAEAGATLIRYVGPDESEEGYQSDAANVWRFMIDAMREDFSTRT
ncbi:hypothetical protein [Sphingobium bisphenolivorans]|uniref:hypothetical protein n=1 Tax=Sphingobium bisphenolivorans TaxID=1335760 RepID=UPI00039F4FE3|nr:hypothetical protein [Sphingobium bisphenolivorans]